MITFAAFVPHPPIILPSVGSPEDRAQVKNTISALEKLGKELKEINSDSIIISAPHPDWGFGVPLYFLAKSFGGKIEKVLIGVESPQFYFKKGTKFPISNPAKDPRSQRDFSGFQFLPPQRDPAKAATNKSQIPNSKITLIASGDLSHCLKADGPYGFHPDGPKFDKELMEALKKKDIKKILKLDDLYSNAAECGLRSFCFLLGILEASGVNYQPEILSYEGPFGVGYLVADFKLANAKN